MAGRPGREVLFCYECGDRWHRDDTELICPNCESEFVEILEEPARNAQSDPRRERSPSGFPGILPALLQPLAQGHESYTHGNTTHHQYRSNNGRFSYTTTTFRSPRHTPVHRESPRASPSAYEHGDPLGPIFQNFNAILQGIANNEPHPQQNAGPSAQERPRDPRTRTSPNRFPNFGTPLHGDGHWEQNEHQRGVPWNGNNYPFDAILQDFDNFRSQQPQNRTGPGGATPAGAMPGSAMPGSAMPGGPHPVAAILAQLIGMSRSGDAVYSQEEFDQVMSQLMAQNRGTAPGPASESAIQSLPKKPVDSSMTGDDGKAECSICMDRVELGTEVTVLPCTHWFHGPCVTAWLTEHDTCPHCRRGITTPTEDSGENQEQNPNPGTGNAGSRSNPYILSDSPPRPPFQPGSRPGASNDRRSSHSRPEGHGQSNPGPRGLTGWMRNHFGGGSY